MSAIPHRADRPRGGSQGTAWPLLASTFLLGIGLVSLVDAFSEGPSEVPPLEGEASALQGPIVLIAPGLEHVIAGLAEPGRVVVQRPTDHLPQRDVAYTVLLSNGWELPRLPDGATVSRDETVGEWRVVEVAPQGEPAQAERYDLAAHLDTAEVYFRAYDGNVIPCDRWLFGRWGCGLEDWLWVGPIELRLRDRMERCIWAHPKAGHELVIRFPNVPLGERLAGRYGLSDEAADTPDGGAVRFTIRIDDVEREYDAQSRRGFFSYQVRPRTMGTADVEYTVSAEHDGRRHFCFNAAMQGVGRPPRPEGEAPARDDDEGTGVGTGERARPALELEPGHGLQPVGLGRNRRPTPSLLRNARGRGLGTGERP